MSTRQLTRVSDIGHSFSLYTCVNCLLRSHVGHHALTGLRVCILVGCLTQLRQADSIKSVLQMTRSESTRPALTLHLGKIHTLASTVHQHL